MISRFLLFFVYSKSESTLESVSVPIRLYDNFWRNNPILMKFPTQHYPMNILIDFEDGFYWSKIYWFSAGTTVISSSFDGNVGPIGIGISITFRNRYLLKLLIFHKIWWKFLGAVESKSINSFPKFWKKFLGPKKP